MSNNYWNILCGLVYFSSSHIINFSILSNGLVFLLNQNKTEQNRKLKQKKERERKKENIT